MASTPAGDVTAILRSVQAGEPDALDRLMAVVYDELHRLARQRLAGLPAGQTLQATALVNEAYLRLAGRADEPWENRRHFFFAAARAMRDILVEQARRKAGPCHGGGRRRQELDEAAAVLEPPPLEVLALHEALEELEKQAPEKAQIVQLRYFGGLTMAEIAEVTGQAEVTVHRHWRFIRAWLKQKLGSP